MEQGQPLCHLKIRVTWTLMRGQMITQKVLRTALEHERKRQRSQNLQRSRSETDLLYEEILPEQAVLPGPLSLYLIKKKKT